MGFGEAVRSFFQRYTDFQGRSRRAEYWWPMLMNLVINWGLSAIAIAIGGGFAAYANFQLNALGWVFYGASIIWGLAVLIPGIAVSVRRLHDRNMSGWLLLAFLVGLIIPLINIIAFIAFIVIMALPGTVGPNKYGADPKGGHDVGVFS